MLLNYFTTPLINIIYLQSKIQQAKVANNCLHNIDLTINKGEKIALMGQSSSGKTTLAKILSGYYTKSSGHVILDKASISQAELRQLVTYVPQQTMCLREQYSKIYC